MSHIIRELPGCTDLLPLAARHPGRYPGLLESVARGNARARHDILFAFTQDGIRLDGTRLRDLAGRPLPGRFLDALDADWRRCRVPRVASGLPFHGGWLLFLGYELAAAIEPRLALPVPSTRLPTALALRCPAAIIVDHEREATVLVAESGQADLIERMAGDLAGASPPPPHLPAILAIEEDAPDVFLAGVEKVQAHLRDGDVFQVNLSREWRIRCAAEPSAAALQARLRAANPAPFAALLQQQGWAVVSSSPERLVELRGRQVQTRPIAGTRPRVPGEDDAGRMRELAGHPKERAEHVMLVDLERNDLGRVCEPGSVVVDELMAVESYAHVHHIVSNVAGRLREGVTPGEVIAALFPGGTITGCPKVRCMEIIAALECVGRGAYTGSLGYLDRSGDMDLNILIRTLAATGDRLHFRAGAGIVADSVAEAELAETRAKARGLLRAFGVAG